MKVDAISKISYYNVRNSFKKNKMNNPKPSVIGRNLTTPTLNQLKAYSKISFKGKEEVLNFINETEKLTKVKDDFSGKTSVEDIKKVFASNPNDLEAFLLEERDIPILNLSNSKQIEAFAEILGEKSPEVFAKAAIMQDKNGRTSVYCAEAPEINALKEALGDRAPEIFASVLTIQSKDDNTTPLHYASANKIIALKEALGDRAPEIFASVLLIQDKYKKTPLHYADADRIIAFKEALGDKALETFANVLTIKDNNGDTPIHCAGMYEINAYKKVLGEDTEKIFQKVLLIKNNEGLLPIYPRFFICDINKLEVLIEVAPDATRKALAQKNGNETYLDYWKDKLK